MNHLIVTFLPSQVGSSSHTTSLWLKHVDFRLGDASNCLEDQSTTLKQKYNVLRAPDDAKQNQVKSKLNGHSLNSISNGDNQNNPEDSPPKPKRFIDKISKVDLQWHDKFDIGAGLVNLGNTCFMNSVLQCLSYCTPLVNYLLNQDNDHSKGECVAFCMACVLTHHIRRAHDQSVETFEPIAIANKLRSIAKSFRPGRQEDAHEYLRHVIDAMCRQSISKYEGKMNIKLDAASKETTIWNHIFGGYLRSQVTCDICFTKSNTFDHFMDFMLDIKNVNSLERALDRFTSVESLSGENEYKCPKCKKKCPAKKRFTVFKPPNVATIQLKRFEYNRIFGGKITKHITFPEILNLRPYMSEPNGETVLYKLNSIIVHLGGSCNSGHYYAYVRSSRDTWFVMDDSRVGSVGLNHVLNQNAYVLFYQRILPSVSSKTSTPLSITANNNYSTKNQLKSSTPISLNPPLFKYPFAPSNQSKCNNNNNNNSNTPTIISNGNNSSSSNGKVSTSSSDNHKDINHSAESSTFVNGHSHNFSNGNSINSSKSCSKDSNGQETNENTLELRRSEQSSKNDARPASPASTNGREDNRISLGKATNSLSNGHTSYTSNNHSESTLTTIGSQVVSWSGEKNSIDSMETSNSMDRDDYDDTYDPEMDRGKVR